MDEVRFDQRLSRLEATVEAVAAQVGTLASSMHEFAQQSRTNWGTMASWAAVVLALVAAIGGLGVARPLGIVEERATEHERINIEQAYFNGVVRTEIEDLKDDLRHIDDRLHKAESNRFTKEDGEKLESRVHEHQKNGHPFSVKAEVDALRKQVEEMKISP